MQDSLRQVIDIQELDMKMIRLMRVKKERHSELEQIAGLRRDLQEQVTEKTREIEEISKNVQGIEIKIQEIHAKLKKLEAQQASVKKVDEFNALTQEMTASERERISLEQKASDLVDKRVAEEDLLQKIHDGLKNSEESSLALEKEIHTSIDLINEEGRMLKKERDVLAETADPEVLRIYERLLRNKRDRVIVPIENRTCSGCQIALTAQHENLVRKGENLAFCEHCSRIHYWQDTVAAESGAAQTTRRRRRRTPTSS